MLPEPGVNRFMRQVVCCLRYSLKCRNFDLWILHIRWKLPKDDKIVNSSAEMHNNIS